MKAEYPTGFLIFAFSELSHGPDESTVHPSMQCEGRRPPRSQPHNRASASKLFCGKFQTNPIQHSSNHKRTIVHNSETPEGVLKTTTSAPPPMLSALHAVKFPLRFRVTTGRFSFTTEVACACMISYHTSM